MNPVFFLSIFALYPLVSAAKEDWKEGMVMNVFSHLLLFGALVSWLLWPDFMYANLNLGGIIVWALVLVLAKYNQWKFAKKNKEEKGKMLGLADIYLGLALTLLLGMWANFLFSLMSLGLFVYLVSMIFKNPEELKTIFSMKTKLVPFYLIGLIGLIFLLFFA